MRPKYKVTGCARFFVFLIIFVPLVFFGAAYFRGENGVTILKEYYHQVLGHPETPGTTKPTDDPDARIKELEKELKAAKDKIRELEDELRKKEGEGQ